ncbi:MAG: citryl-CoA lyase [Candidatus Magasanikbacteria bacterium]|nr:citryl-CoA lyase [Candidatus Magasanikbacteria bacterium]
MKFKTSITQIKDDKEIIRGKTLESLVKKQSFVATIFLLLFGRLPKKNEEVVFNALLVSAIDHGPGTTSALNARISASAGNPVHASLAAGILGFGERHGMAVEGAMKFFYENEGEKDLRLIITDLKERKVRLPGFGHKVFTKVDPRSVTLFTIAKKQKIFGKYCMFAGVVHKELNAVSSKPLPLNIDGAIAAILCDMKVPVELGNTIFLMGRIPGLLAHIYEERTNDVGIRRLEEGEIEHIF